MGKSSSRKKKRSDASPLARKSRKSKSKRTRNKSKKLRRRHDSESYSSNYDSPVSSYSTSEGDHKRTRRPRSPMRGSKRSRRRSYSSESSDDSRPARKRKRSRRDDDVCARKKGHKKKLKAKRRASVSSISNGSLSFSTCDGGSRSSDEGEFESRRGRSRRRDDRDPHAGKDKAAGERSRYRSMSCSSYSRCSISGDDLSEKRVAIATSSMKLKSVIMVCDNTQESKLDRDEQKEEILYDKDDYPSRSNDSNDGGGKRALASQFSVDSTMKRQAGNEEIEKASDLGMRSAGLVEISEAGLDLVHASNPSSDVAPSLYTVKQDNIADAVDEDLELVLRQRALENLKRFQRSDKVGEVSDHHGKNNDVKQTPVEMKVSKEDSARSELTTRHQENVAGIHKRLSTNTTSVDGQTGGKELEAAGSSITRGSVQVTGGKELEAAGSSITRGSVHVTGGGFPANKPRTFTWRRDSAKTDLVSKEQLRPSNAKPQHKLLATQIAANSAKLLPPGDISSGDSGVNKQSGSAALDPTSSSCTKYVSGETSSADKVQDELKDKPQYEEKTMSVTRGGETIQVSYQVYIPKRVPALARKHLKR